MIGKNVSRVLKGLAILIVIASHYAEWMFVEASHPQLQHCIGTWGPPGVDIFFLLSGYGLYKSAEKSGIDLKFVWKRIVAVYLPYLLISFGIECYCDSWKEADAAMLFRFFTASDYWYMNVLFVMYIGFMLCFRFCGRWRIPVLSVLLVLHSVWLVHSGHSDFWTLSNAAFLLGIFAAAAEKKWGLFEKKRNCLILFGSGVAGSVITFFWMRECGGSGAEGAYAAELVMNLFISLAVLGAAYLLPEWKSFVLAHLGDASLFVYLLHTIMFYAIIFKLEKLTYLWANVCTALITLLFAVILSKLYGLLSKLLLGGIGKKAENRNESV